MEPDKNKEIRTRCELYQIHYGKYHFTQMECIMVSVKEEIKQIKELINIIVNKKD